MVSAERASSKGDNSHMHSNSEERAKIVVVANAVA